MRKTSSPSGGNNTASAGERDSRTSILSWLLVAGIFLSVPFWVVDFVRGNLRRGWVGVATVVLFGLVWFLLRFGRSRNLATGLGVGVASLVFLYLIAFGDMGAGAFVWAVLLPFAAIFALGRKWGAVVTIVFAVFAAALLAAGVSSLSSDAGLTVRFLFALAAALGLAYHFQRTTEGANRRVLEHSALLSDSERKYRRVFEESNDGILLHDLDGTIGDANGAACNLLGYSFDTLQYMNIHSLFADAHAKAPYDALEDTKRIGSARFESVFRRADNTTVAVEISSRIVDRERGLVLAIVRDIAQRKRAEERDRRYTQHMEFLSTSAVRFLGLSGSGDEIYRLIGEGLTELTPGSIILISEAVKSRARYELKGIWGMEKGVLGKALQLVGFDPVGREWEAEQPNLELLRQDKLVTLKGGLAELGRGALPQPVLTGLRHLLGIETAHAMGLVRRAEVAGAVFIFSRKGKPLVNKLFVEAFIRQASMALYRRALERELLTAREAAEKASRAKGEFLASMSHEVRTPMNAVIGLIDLALDMCGNSGQREYLSGARGAARALLGILEDVLDYSRIESGKLSLDHAAFSPTDVVTEACATGMPEARKKGLDLRWSVDSDLPGRLMGDPRRVRQILINLVHNAVKFTDTGSISLKVVRGVSMEASQGRAWLEFALRDTGRGIPSGKHERIFDSFTKVDGQAEGTQNGVGLGLAICRHLARLMGGDVTVSSEVGKGSTFVFRAPFEIAEGSAGADVARVSDQLAASPSDFGGARILVAEDNALNRLVAVRTLEKWNVRTVEAADGALAVGEYSKGEIDLVLMDIQMPTMDGLEAARKMRSMGGKRVPIVGLSAHVRPEDRAHCMEAGMDDYLPKPLEPERLRDVLRRLLCLEGAGPPEKTVSVSRPGPADHFDAPELERRLGGDRVLGAEVVGQFIGTLPYRLSEIDGSLSANDIPLLARLAHKLAGTALTISAPRVVELARALEESCDALRGQAEYSRLVSEIHGETDTVRDAMRRYLDPELSVSSSSPPPPRAA